MLSTGITGALGFIFWIIASHLYTAVNVGLATSLISAAGLTVSLSTLGLNNVIIRYSAHAEDQSRLLSTASMLVAAASVIFSLGFLGWAAFSHSPLLRDEPLFVGLLFVIYVVVLTLNGLIDGAIISHLAAKYVLAKNACQGVVKLTLPIVFISAAYVGLVAATVSAASVAMILGWVILMRRLKYVMTLSLNLGTLFEMRGFALGNYLGGIFGILPGTLMPLIVLTRLGASQAGYYYMPAMIVALVNVIPLATAQSLFAEVSHDEANLRRYTLQALRNLFALLLPATASVALLAPIGLNFFGQAYASHGTGVLQILALASLFGGANYIGDALLNIQKRPVAYVVMNALNSVLIVGLGYIVAPHGLVSIALAALVGQIATMFVYVVVNAPLVGRPTVSR